MTEVLQDRLALSFIVDAVLTLMILTIHFARRPAGPTRPEGMFLVSCRGALQFG